jgi:hypothetical protein
MPLERISWSLVSNLDECARKTQYKYQLGLIPGGEEYQAMFGTATHLALGAYYKSGRSVAEAKRVFRDAWEPSEGKDPHGIRTLEKGYELIEAYDRLFVEEPWTFLGGEQTFAIEIPGVSQLFTGIIDAFGNHVEGEAQVTIQEFKTSTTPWNFVAYPNGQMVSYAYAAKSLLQKEVKRVYATMFGVFKGSKGGQQRGKSKDDPPREVINREVIDLSAWDFEEWQRDVREASLLVRRYEEVEYWPKRTRSCGGYGGCPYRAICMTPPSQRAFIMETSYERKEWSPLNERR